MADDAPNYRETFGKIALDALDDIPEGREVQGIAVIVATDDLEGGSNINYRFKNGLGEDLNTAAGLQMIGGAINGIALQAMP